MIDWWKAGALFVVVVGFFAWCGERDARIRAEGRAEFWEAEADSISADLVELGDSTVAARIRAEEEIARADSVQAVAEDAIARARAERPVLVDSVVIEAGPDSTVVREAVERVAASYEEELDAQRAILASYETVVGSLRAENAALVEENRVQRDLIAALRASNEARARSTPGFLSRNVERALVFLNGVGVGALLVEAVR